MFFSSHFPSGIGFSRGTVAAKIAKAESRGKRKRSFHFGSAEPHPVLGEAKDLQVERSGKRKRSFHLGSAEPHPVLGEAKDLQVERRGKSKTRFSLLTSRVAVVRGRSKRVGRASKRAEGTVPSALLLARFFEKAVILPARGPFPGREVPTRKHRTGRASRLLPGTTVLAPRLGERPSRHPCSGRPSSW